MELKKTYKKILISTAICLLIAGVVFWGIANNKVFNEIVITQAQENLLTIARTESQHISRGLKNTYGELKVLAENPVLKQGLINGKMATERPSPDAYSPAELTYHHLMKGVDALANSRNVYIGMTFLMIILLGTVGYFYRTYKERAVLESEAKSAKKLQLINSQMQQQIKQHFFCKISFCLI